MRLLSYAFTYSSEQDVSSGGPSDAAKRYGWYVEELLCSEQDDLTQRLYFSHPEHENSRSFLLALVDSFPAFSAEAPRLSRQQERWCRVLNRLVAQPAIAAIPATTTNSNNSGKAKRRRAERLAVIECLGKTQTLTRLLTFFTEKPVVEFVSHLLGTCAFPDDLPLVIDSSEDLDKVAEVDEIVRVFCQGDFMERLVEMVMNQNPEGDSETPMALVNFIAGLLGCIGRSRRGRGSWRCLSRRLLELLPLKVFGPLQTLRNPPSWSFIAPLAALLSELFSFPVAALGDAEGMAGWVEMWHRANIPGIIVMLLDRIASSDLTSSASASVSRLLLPAASAHAFANPRLGPERLALFRMTTSLVHCAASDMFSPPVARQVVAAGLVERFCVTLDNPNNKIFECECEMVCCRMRSGFTPRIISCTWHFWSL